MDATSVTVVMERHTAAQSSILISDHLLPMLPGDPYMTPQLPGLLPLPQPIHLQPPPPANHHTPRHTRHYTRGPTSHTPQLASPRMGGPTQTLYRRLPAMFMDTHTTQVWQIITLLS